MKKNKSELLLVEDDVSLGQTISELLIVNNYNVKWCQNGLEAFQYLENNAPDLIVCDLMMPVMSGEELFLKIPEPKKGEESVLLQLGNQEMVLPNQEFVLYTNGIPTLKGMSNEQGLIALNMNVKANQTLEYMHDGNTYQVPLNQGKVVAADGIKAIELKALASNIIPEENLPKLEVEETEKDLWAKNQGQFDVRRREGR